ncbi:MAG: hypothetical protein R2854_07615 [Caldilineaceae bacterium]
MAGAPNAPHRLTDCVRLLAAEQQRIAGYQALDPTRSSASTRRTIWTGPRSSCRSGRCGRDANQERNLIRFGTGGWRAHRRRLYAGQCAAIMSSARR